MPWRSPASRTVALLYLACIWSAIASAQEYPTRPVRLIVSEVETWAKVIKAAGLQ